MFGFVNVLEHVHVMQIRADPASMETDSGFHRREGGGVTAEMDMEMVWCTNLLVNEYFLGEVTGYCKVLSEAKSCTVS